MENEIEVNEYVRINMDNRNCIGIGRVSRIVNETIYVNMSNKYLPVSFQIDKIVKHSKKIIDLIEVGDIVEDQYNKYEVAFIAGNKIYCNDYYDDDSLVVLEEKDLKTILTREQYLDDCYKVGGEVE